MYFSKQFKDSIESISVTRGTTTTYVKVTFKQWWRFSKTYKFQWVCTNIDRDLICTYKEPELDINRLLKALKPDDSAENIASDKTDK